MTYKIEKGQVKGTIVFVHGNSSSSFVFDAVLKSKLIPQTKITIDLPGHGVNADEGNEIRDFSIEVYRAKLIDLLSGIDDDILLVGNSLGGHLVIEVAQEINRLKGLVIFGTPPLKKPLNLEEAFLPVDALQTFFTENPSDANIESAINLAVQNKEHVRDLIKDFKKANPKVRTAVAVDIGEANFLDQYAIFTTLKVPKFIIVGKQDPSVNPKYLELVKNCAEDCELIDFEDCGHYPSVEKSETFISTINRVVSKVFN